MDFGQALTLVKQNHRVSRTGWNGKGMWIAIQRPGTGSPMTRPFIFIKGASGELIPWLPSQADLLAEDWEVLPDEPPVGVAS